ncbi:unnamed protein product [Gadus morhua 'NCC']
MEPSVLTPAAALNACWAAAPTAASTMETGTRYSTASKRSNMGRSTKRTVRLNPAPRHSASALHQEDSEAEPGPPPLCLSAPPRGQ